MQVESPSMSKDRKEIYLGAALRRLLTGRKESLTTIVNLIAERYEGIMARANTKGCSVQEDDVYRDVLKEYRRPLESADIAAFPARVKDYCLRTGLDREPMYPAMMARVERCSYVDLVALIDRLERSQ